MSEWCRLVREQEALLPQLHVVGVDVAALFLKGGRVLCGPCVSLRASRAGLSSTSKKYWRRIRSTSIEWSSEEGGENE